MSKSKVICIFAGAALLVFAGYMFITQLNDYLKSTRIYDYAAKEYISVNSDEGFTEEKPDIEVPDWINLVEVDIQGLCEENEDIAGWIYFENVDISYPVLYSEDTSKYLQMAYNGVKSSAGSIFMEGNNNKDFSDAHTILYGHNMKNLSMFGRLRYYVIDADFITDHKYFQIITEEAKYRYKIISYKVVPEESAIYTVYREGSSEFPDFVKRIIQRGNYVDTEENIEQDDHLITLSTCYNDDRLVVTAVRCDECDN